MKTRNTKLYAGQTLYFVKEENSLLIIQFTDTLAKICYKRAPFQHNSTYNEMGALFYELHAYYLQKGEILAFDFLTGYVIETLAA